MGWAGLGMMERYVSSELPSMLHRMLRALSASEFAFCLKTLTTQSTRHTFFFRLLINKKKKY